MALTVAEIVKTPHLRLELLATGDLDRTVRWVHATDQPDPGPYLRGGEVVLTDGLWLASGTSPVDYARRLADADAAAIGFGLIEDGPPVPDPLIRACRRRRLTLFAVPVDVPFLAISELFVERVIREREEPLRQMLRHSERLLEAVSSPDGAMRVIQVLSAELGRETAMYDQSGRELARAGKSAADARPERRFAVPGPTGVAFELGVLTGGRPLSVQDEAAIQQALSVLSIEAAHREALRQTHRRFAAELFELAREGESQGIAIAQRLRGLGIDPDRGLIAIVCEIPDPEARLGQFEDALSALGLRAATAPRGGRLVAVAEWDPAAATDALRDQLVDAMGPAAAIGIGAPVADCALLDVSVTDARRACRLARMRQDGARGATSAEVASHAGLLAIQDADFIEDFCRKLLGPVEGHDASRGSELTKTLEAFVLSGGRWAETAARLHVHVNTLRHRLARVEQLTGRRLENADDRVDFHLALRARAARSAA